ncbi:AraC family transcriptional regulator [Paenibacillus sp. sgz500958]|uniref:AraC family transcriptional regulator n=1 Tax=Paenibacillus sp. sgz500958 TaxID=3242475 RepID=UPI0036D24D63
MPRDIDSYPVYPYSVGRHVQYHHVRPAGFPVHQIFLIRSGSGLFRDLESGTDNILEPGMAFSFPPDRGHEYYPLSHEPWHVGFVGLSGSSCHDFLERAGMLPSSPFHPVSFEECWSEIGNLWHGANPQPAVRHDEESMQGLSVMLYKLLLMLRIPSQSPGTMNKPRSGEIRGGALQKAVELINGHFTEPLLISNLASAVGYSVQHFQRLFLQEYGITPHQYLQDLRLERALQILTENTAIPIQDIAANLGMETNYFIRIFRKTYGCTPGVMRRRLHGQDS